MARTKLIEVAHGHDPATKKAKAKQATAAALLRVEGDQVIRPTDSFATAWAAFEADHISTLRPSTAAEWKWVFRKVFQPRWGKFPLGDITSTDVVSLLHGLRRFPSASDKARAVLQVFFNWTVAEPDKCFTVSPCRDVPKVKRRKGSDEEDDRPAT